MNVLYAISSVVALGLFAYLAYVLCKPESF